jgi:hypothetical protein
LLAAWTAQSEPTFSRALLAVATKWRTCTFFCGVCHKDSEYLDGERYMGWLMQRSPVDRLMSEAMRCGSTNPAVLMQPNVANKLPP